MMRRVRDLRGRSAALALLPVTALITVTAVLSTGSVLDARAGASEQAEITASKQRVSTGSRVRLSGRFPSPSTQAAATTRSTSSARRVVIQFRPAGEQGWRDRGAAATDERGRWSRRISVPRSGRFRAVSSDGRVSAPQLVRARTRLRPQVASRHVNAGSRVPIRGRAAPRGSRRQVVVRVGGERLKTRTKPDGRFQVRWRARRTGRHQVTIRARGDRAADGNRRRAGRVTVYRPAQASWYGPGFYGNRTACGQTLTTSTLGVAHRTMPCGTRLTLRHKGRSVRVRVIDRGPFHAGREFDLTGATKNRLRFGSTGTVYSSR